MGDAAPGDAWVFHAGALGDFVLIWPLIRALARAHPRVHVVADSEKAALAARWLDAGVSGQIVPHDAQRRSFTRLWTGEPAVAADITPDAAIVINAVAPAASAWTAAAARTMFPAARIVPIDAPGSASRAAALRDFGSVLPAARVNPSGALVCHVGAGGGGKRWPLARWSQFREFLIDELPLRVIAGEVEAERFAPGERLAFMALGGSIVGTLDELAHLLAAARGFVGADTGPTHLAAQLGIPTLAIFGPTDHRIWAPIGPRVHAMHPPSPAPMDWAHAEPVASAIRDLIASQPSDNGARVR